MRRMGGLKRYMPITFVTMGIGTLAIAGVPGLSGFFSKDEILLYTFLHNPLFWVVAVITAGMTAFYMFRLMFMTFYRDYRGPAWDDHGGHDHGHDHVGDDAHGHAWHGPHESPRLMTVPLMVLAFGAIVAGYVGIPAALGGSMAIEHFLEPSFVAHAGEGGHGDDAHHISHAAELGLMALSVLVAGIGIFLAYRNYFKQPEVAEQWAEKYAGAHRVLTNKYYVDELYDATVIRGTMRSARGLWGFDSAVVDGVVNGTGWLTIAFSWVSHVLDKYVVDGIVNLVGWICKEGSFGFRRVQTGLIQNYAFATLVGVFAFVTWFIVGR